MKKMNNKGFSLVELIIVIAIMAVLIGVMAPQFLKYVEQSKRSTDISNAQSIATAIQADIADGKITTSQSGDVTASTASALNEDPVIRGTAGGAGGKFTFTADPATGIVRVNAGSYNLYPGTSATNGAAKYKAAN